MDKSAYKQGFVNGIKAYAYQNNGIYYVGTTGRTLERAIHEVEQTWNYAPSPTEVLQVSGLRLSNYETISLSTDNSRLD